MTTPRWTEHRVFQCLQQVYPAPAYVLLPQVRNGTGFRRRRTRTIDALAVSIWPSRGLYLTGFEIKVSRSDWRKELADPQKSADMQKYCRYWYVVAPQGVVDEGEVPANWGLLVCQAVNSIVNAKAAVSMPAEPWDELLMCSILRTVHDTMLPREALEETVQDRLAKHSHFALQAKDRRITELESLIQRFEEASGVSLSNTWDAAPLGEAVKFVRESGVLCARDTVKRLQGSLQQAGDILAHALANLSEQEGDAEA